MKEKPSSLYGNFSFVKNHYTIFAPHWKLFYFHRQTFCAFPRFCYKSFLFSWPFVTRTPRYQWLLLWLAFGRCLFL